MSELILPGTLDSLEQVADFIHAEAAAAGFDKKAAYRMHLAVDEVATNVVTHAYEEKGVEGNLYLFSEHDASGLTIHLEDTGEPYDPTQRGDPDDLNKPLEERGIGGLGIFLARKNVDTLRYERRGDRNRMSFFMKSAVTP